MWTKKVMRRFFIAIMVGITIVGCTSSRYISYTTQTFPPKPSSYKVPFYNGRPYLGRKYKIIGELYVSGDTQSFAGWNDIYNKARAEARKRGADAVIDVKTDYQEYSGVNYIPGSTTYQPVTTHHSGWVSANTYSSQGYGNYASGTGTYYGTSTTYIPVHTPPTVVPYTGAILRYRGLLIVFEEPSFFETLQKIREESNKKK